MDAAASPGCWTRPGHPGAGTAARQELLYRLLTGEQGLRLRAIAAADSQGHRPARAVAWIKENFDQPLSIEALADAANMSKSTLHQHFRRSPP